MLIDLTRQPVCPQLIHHGRLPEIIRPVANRECQARRRQTLIPVERRAMITSTDRGALRHQEMSAGRCVIDIGIYLGRERALDVTIHQRLNGARQLRRPGASVYSVTVLTGVVLSCRALL